jgi:hypothetical protein
MFSAPALQVAGPVHEIQGFNSEMQKRSGVRPVWAA